MAYGLHFKYKNGEEEYYDPISELKTGLYHYIFYIGGHTYQIPIENVLEMREYPLCDVCGYEDSDTGCPNCAEKEELEKLRNEIH